MKILQILFLIFGLTVFANAQEKISLLSGKVFDLNKKALPMTAITVTGSNKLIFKTISDDIGFYRIWLPAGKYTIEFHKYGFKRTIFNDFEDSERLGKTVNITIEPGVCNDCNGDLYSDEVENIRKPDEIDFSKPKEKIGIINGNAIDEFGAALPDLILRFRNKYDEEFQSLTNSDGNFLIKIPYGSYKVFAEFKGVLKNKAQKIKVSKFENKAEKIVLSCKYSDKAKCFAS